MLITYIRHGESEFNSKGIMQGVDDPDLSPKGIEQVEALADRLNGVRGVQVFASPLKRALQTAQPVAACAGVDITVIEDLKEIDIGCFSNLTRQQAEIKYPHLFEDPEITFWKLFRDDARYHRSHGGQASHRGRPRRIPEDFDRRTAWVQTGQRGHPDRQYLDYTVRVC